MIILEKPRVFANPINKKITNSQEVFYETKGNQRVISSNYENILKTIDNIFNSLDHVYKSRVSITTNDGDITCDIVGKTANSILTLDGKSIRISDIRDIKKI